MSSQEGKPPNHKFTLLTTVREKEKYFNRIEVKEAERAKPLMTILGRPFFCNYLNLLMDKTIPNLNIGRVSVRTEVRVRFPAIPA